MTYDSREKSVTSGAPIECYRLTLGLGIFRFTSCDTTQTISVAGDGPQAFAPLAIERGEPQVGDSLQAGEMEVTIPLSSALGQALVGVATTIPVGVQIYRFHDGDSDITLAFTGSVIGVECSETTCTMKVATLPRVLRRKIPPYFYQKQCNFHTYGVQCGVDRNAFKDTAILTYATGITVKAAAFATRADGWFTFGYIETATGEWAYITAHVGDTLTLLAPLPGAIVGAGVSAYAGDDRLEATCAAKFNNLRRFFGFSRVPDKNPHESGIG